jgi:hypothetical protein
MAGVAITGVKELDRKLRRIDAKLGKKIVTQGSRRALKPVQLAARRFVPVDTGELRKGIKVKALRRSRKRFGSRVTSAGRNVEDLYYGGFQEWGWTTKSGRHVFGQLFMTNAARTKKRSAITIFTRYVKGQIESEARR